jgi:hypothetical protein|tara:strand:- start:57 stop:1091 length:1035 start_codon:yes stop_codon:yes gene_type:complete
MAYSTINKSTDYFNTKLYTGNGGTNAVTGVGFQPDWSWIKNRSGSDNHALYDAVRGVNKILSSNNTNAEATQSDGLTAFGTDGFTVGASGSVNTNGNNFVSWHWKAGGSSSANTDGTINSTVSVNTTAGFSIVTWAGTNAQATIGHGLGVAPSLIIVKNRTSTVNWLAYFKPLGANKYLEFNLTNGSGTSNTEWGNTEPTSTVFTVGNTGSTNTSGANYVAYCFAEKTGFSKVGNYIGNNNADGPFVYTGFAVKFVLLKKDGGDGWWLVDDKQANPYPNPNAQMIVSNTGAGDNTSVSPFIDIYSNGFKLKSNWAGVNGNGSDYVYYAVGQSLVGSNNIPCNAR